MYSFTGKRWKPMRPVRLLELRFPAFFICTDDVRLSPEQEADAAFYQQKREAEGILEIAKAYGALVDVLGCPQDFLQYRMLETGSYEVGSDKWSCYSRT
jgi:hypothetical protein